MRIAESGATTLIARCLVLALCACGVASPSAAQRAVTATSGTPAAIARVRAGVAATVREAPGYRRTTHDLQNFSLEGGELVGLYRGRELRKLEARLFGESWRGSEEYYFAGGRLIFLHVVHERYDEPMSGRVAATIEHRFYFDGGRLIRRVRTQRPASRRDLRELDPDLPELLETSRLFAACAAASGDDPPACTAPDR